MSLSHGHFLCVHTGQSPREGARGRLTARSLASGVGQSSARNEPGGDVVGSKMRQGILLIA